MITAAVALLIVYGSLYPFHFQVPAFGAGPLQVLLKSIHRRPQRGDFIANTLLYLPLGWFAIQSLRRRPGIWYPLIAAGAGAALSTALECLQYYDLGRQTSIWDVTANGLGALVGALAGARMHRRSGVAPSILVRRPYLTVLIACWIGNRLYPYVPVIDLHAWWHAVQPLLIDRSVQWLDVYRHCAWWLCLALILEPLAGGALTTPVLILLAGFVEGARVLIGTHLSWPETGGIVIALLAWIAVLSRMRNRAVTIALLFTGMIILESLRPFHFLPAARPFQWIPFYGFLHGSIGVNVTSFLEKAFTYGALLWLAMRSGLSFATATAAGAGLLVALRFAQVYLPGRSAESTDVLMLLAMAALSKALGEDAR